MNPPQTRRLLFVGVVGLLAAMAAGAVWWFGSRPSAPSRRVERQHCPLAAQPADAPHPGLVWVPGGQLTMGDTVYADEQPVQAIEVAGFWMDRTEVTNAQFAAFVKATGYVTQAERPPDASRHRDLPPALRQPGAVVFVMPNDVRGRGEITQWWRYTPGANWRHPGGPGTDIDGREAFPVVAVTLEDALAYARWRGHTLPTEAQWEWAAREARAAVPSSLAPPPAANTWQGLFPVINTADDGFVGVAPVGCYAPNALGLFDLIGNVWELTADRWTPDHRQPLPTATGNAPAVLPASAAVQHVIKGGSFLCASNYCMRYRAGSRQPQDDDLGASHLGFRTIVAAPGP